MPFTKRAPKEEREKQKEIKKIARRIEGLQEMYKFVSASVSVQAGILKGIDELDLGAEASINRAERELNSVKKTAKEYKTEIDHLKDFLSKLDPNHKLLQPNKPQARQTERKHSHQVAMSADAPKVKVKSPATIKNQVSFKDEPVAKKPKLK